MSVGNTALIDRMEPRPLDESTHFFFAHPIELSARAALQDAQDRVMGPLVGLPGEEIQRISLDLSYQEAHLDRYIGRVVLGFEQFPGQGESEGIEDERRAQVEADIRTGLEEGTIGIGALALRPPKGIPFEGIDNRTIAEDFVAAYYAVRDRGSMPHGQRFQNVRNLGF